MYLQAGQVLHFQYLRSHKTMITSDAVQPDLQLGVAPRRRSSKDEQFACALMWPFTLVSLQPLLELKLLGMLSWSHEAHMKSRAACVIKFAAWLK